MTSLGALLVGTYISDWFGIVFSLATATAGILVLKNTFNRLEAQSDLLQSVAEQTKKLERAQKLSETLEEISAELLKQAELNKQNKAVKDYARTNYQDFDTKSGTGIGTYIPAESLSGKIDMINMFGAQFAHRHGANINLDEWMETQGIYSSVHKKMIVEYLDKFLEEFSPPPENLGTGIYLAGKLSPIKKSSPSKSPRRKRY
ncbi:MAG: hypothetical protein AAGC45_10535 [Bacteroidota bacterium]